MLKNNFLLKIFVFITISFPLNATTLQAEQGMDKIIISKHDENHSISWAVRDMVEILIKEHVPLTKINQDALKSYWFTNSLHNFKYGGYASFLYKIKNNKQKKETIFKLLKEIKATKHLAYMLKQEKAFQALSSQEQKEFTTAEYYGYINKSISKKVKGSGYKEIAKNENLEKLQEQWLKSLNSFEVSSFDDKYAYLSKVVGKNIMPIDKNTKEIYASLITWNEKKVFFDLMKFAEVEIWGEIEKFYWREWAPDANDIDSIGDEFYSFGVDGAGGHFLLWHYEGMKKEPAIVYFSSEGEKIYLAPSFNEFVCTLPNIYGERTLKTYLASLDEKVLQESIKTELYEFFEEYEEKNNVDFSANEMATLLKKEIHTYQKLVCKNETNKKNNSEIIEEKKRFDILCKRLDGGPFGVFDYLKAYYEIYKKLSH